MPPPASTPFCHNAGSHAFRLLRLDVEVSSYCKEWRRPFHNRRPEAGSPLGGALEPEPLVEALRPEVPGTGADGEEGAGASSRPAERPLDQASADPRAPRPLDHVQVVEIDAALPGLGAVHPAQDRVAEQRRPAVRGEGGDPRVRAEEVPFESGQTGAWLVTVVSRELAHHLQDVGHVRLSRLSDQRYGHVTVGRRYR